MQPTFERFNELPKELKIETAHNLSVPDLVSLSLTSKSHLTLFKPIADVLIVVRKLLPHVVQGKHEAVQAILKKDISLIFKRGVVTDCSGRTFESISAFEYALWAIDKHMWAAMIACIPENEEGREIVAQLMAQYNKLNKDGVTYRIHGKAITEKHFDFENTIIKELQTQVDSIRATEDKNWDAIHKQWREGVGGAQKKLPMHVVDEYCSEEPFYPVPQFTSQPTSLKQFYNWTTEKDEAWFDVDSKLGSEFAIYKGRGLVTPRPNGLGLCVADLDAMKALYEVRTKDFIDLESQLEKGASLDNYPQVVMITS
ncbi:MULTISPECIES: F-box protein [unclassified Legionella]|uniref:F-box protein n=1 Tax=unclassified Legionella TaxID=2622702 RepID=UPI0010566D25|nr:MULTISPECIES: F-box protein [unclassified Legionella]MDI9817936.1 F-box protein [Legionella sp. PL877]